MVADQVTLVSPSPRPLGNAMANPPMNRLPVPVGPPDVGGAVVIHVFVAVLNVVEADVAPGTRINWVFEGFSV